MADGKRRGREEGQLQAARLGFQPSALLGRTYPGGALPPLRHRARPGGSAARAFARCGKLRAHRQWRKPPVHHDRLGQHHLPPLRRPRQAGDRHHAPVGRFQLVLPALLRPPQRQGIRQQGSAGLLHARGLVQRRHGAHHPAPSLQPVLAPVPPRSGAGLRIRSAPATA